MGNTKIEWAEKSWNPVTGCTKISEGCKNCYAERMSKRLAGRCGYPADNPFKVTLHPERLDEPLRWKKPSRIFVCSMGDLFHEDVEPSFIQDVFWKMEECSQHIFMVLTKRPERMRKLLHVFYKGSQRILPKHIWLGVTAENQEQADKRIPILLQIPAAVRFISYEPALGPVDFGLVGGPGDPDWIIAGGESGPHARPAHPDWFRSAREQCQAAGVPFMFKQWGEFAPQEEPGVYQNTICISEGGECYRAGKNYIYFPNESDGVLMRKYGKAKAGRLLDGRIYDECPEVTP